MSVFYSIVGIFIHVPAFLLVVTIHGYAKAAVSLAVGDKGPAESGRLTFNPVKHLDAFGFLCFFFFRLGWSKPMDLKPFSYKGDRRKNELIVSIFPLAVNLMAAAVFAVCVHFLSVSVPREVLLERGGQRFLYDLMRILAFQNMTFVIFNLIPIYPLDGSRILAVVKPGWWAKIKNNERMAQTVLMVLMFLHILDAFISTFAAGILSFII